MYAGIPDELMGFLGPGPIPTEFFELRFLKKMDLSDNEFTGGWARSSFRSSRCGASRPLLYPLFESGPIPPCVSNLASIKELYLDHNQMTGPLPVVFLAMVERIQALRLRGNKFTLLEGPEDDLILRDVKELVLPDSAIR
jgi:hypothetical protein